MAVVLLLDFSLGSTGARLTGRFLGPVVPLVYARHGRELMGCKSPVR